MQPKFCVLISSQVVLILMVLWPHSEARGSPVVHVGASLEGRFSNLHPDLLNPKKSLMLEALPSAFGKASETS